MHSRVRMQQVFIGIDVAFAKGKRLPVSVCRWEGRRLVPFLLRDLELEPPRGSGNAATMHPELIASFADDTVRYLESVCGRLNVEAVRIGLDAPRAPRSNQSARRAAEAALDRAGIHCFTTPSLAEFAKIRERVAEHLAGGGAESRIPHANQLWMLVGFELFRRLECLAPCIEVFPQATARAIGAGQIHKFKAGGVAAQAAAVAQHTGWPSRIDELGSIAWAPLHDCLDAYLSAWVAALDEGDRAFHGQAPHDAIWVPRLDTLPLDGLQAVSADPATPDPMEAGEGSDEVGKLCPGCGRMRFRRWPWGWDAHAAHVCTGLEGTDPVSRKREYKERFSHFFG